MSDIKCPFCQQELNQDNPQSIECRNDDCKKSYFMYGSKELWQELIRIQELLEIEDAEHSMCHTQMLKTTEKLERTRKALDVAVDALKRILNHATAIDTARCRAEMALEQITALEQKESAFVHNKIEFPEYNDNLLEEFDKQFFENGQDDDLTETALEQKDVK